MHPKIENDDVEKENVIYFIDDDDNSKPMNGESTPKEVLEVGTKSENKEANAESKESNDKSPQKKYQLQEEEAEGGLGRGRSRGQKAEGV